ncbi:hypothetical protein Pla123a_05220 [Posidoniimonas polymericola]|uniref:DUF374 domain-containing protein n=1 Tax=Posidoniimonas polymericola TaxID=2528002 RepID=A0A5C5ZF37_9BACT|nr:DUF374 domain-containing protein [Posidoniimonas polymericola]TWT85715.1 hypothetical protein Pla123a_05220 [Posidoniimonas polymericola]
MSLSRRALSWLIALAIVTLRITCRVRVYNDPRPKLREAGLPYTYSTLHAHQVAVVINREPGTAAMVSQSKDGQLLIPAFKLMRVRPKCGSSGGGGKGGRAALQGLADNLRGGDPAILAVDGPIGPRGRVSKGVAVLAKQTGCAVINVVGIPTSRWIITKAWDRLQIPKPFSTIHGYFGEPLFYQVGESIEDFRLRVEEQLNALEQKHDPEEAAAAAAATAARPPRRRRVAA